MEKIRVTKQQRANAIEARDVMWPSVPPENVAVELGDWCDQPRTLAPDCGTQACFGGWCAVWPPFVAQGVGRTSYGSPELANGEGHDWDLSGDHSVARALFGDSALFASRQPGERGTDHEVVTKRLRALIRNSVVTA